MAIPYRTRRAFKRVATVLLALALVAVFILLWLCGSHDLTTEELIALTKVKKCAILGVNDKTVKP